MRLLTLLRLAARVTTHPLSLFLFSLSPRSVSPHPSAVTNTRLMSEVLSIYVLILRVASVIQQLQTLDSLIRALFVLSSLLSLSLFSLSLCVLSLSLLPSPPHVPMKTTMRS